jgi:hypothetical protein
MLRLLLKVRRGAQHYWMRGRRSEAVDAHAATLDRVTMWLFKWRGVNVAEADKLPKFWTPKRALLAAAAFVAIAWSLIFLKDLTDWSPNDRASFGESFGAVSALFNGLALIAAGWAVSLQWANMQREKAEAAASALEDRFFQMLRNLQNTLDRTRVDIRGYIGRQATRKIADWLLKDLKPCRNMNPADDAERLEDIRRWFQFFYDGESCPAGKKPPAPAVDILGHVFRLIYHILKYVNSSKAITREDKESYAAILRAHLSNPELAMLFYNGLTKHGYKKHFPLLVGYRMFDNLNRKVLADPQDWELYLRLRDSRAAEIKAIVGHLPESQADDDLLAR